MRRDSLGLGILRGVPIETILKSLTLLDKKAPRISLDGKSGAREEGARFMGSDAGWF